MNIPRLVISALLFFAGATLIILAVSLATIGG